MTSRASSVRVGLVYPELLGTYGDRGNAIVLVERLVRRGIPAELVEVPAGALLPGSLDVYLFGGGEDDPQALAASGLHTSAPGVRRAREHGAAILAVCAGFQLVGHRYEAGGGRVMDGLGLVDMVTVAGPDRLIGEIVVVPDPATGLPALTGFENHAGRSTLGPAERPLGRVRVGGGNGDGTDGVLGEGIVGTYLHGPVLPRNPALADHLLAAVVGALGPLDDALPRRLHDERLAAATASGWRAWRAERRLHRG